MTLTILTVLFVCVIFLASDSICQIINATSSSSENQWALQSVPEVVGGDEEAGGIQVIAIDDGGNSFISGLYGQWADLGTGTTIFLSKLRPSDGGVLWTVTYETNAPANNICISNSPVAIYNDSAYLGSCISENSNNTYIIRKLDTSDGTLIWEIQGDFTFGAQVTTAVAVDSAGDLFVTVDIYPTALASDSDCSTLLMKISQSNGSIIWSNTDVPSGALDMSMSGDVVIGSGGAGSNILSASYSGDTGVELWSRDLLQNSPETTCYYNGPACVYSKGNVAYVSCYDYNYFYLTQYQPSDGTVILTDAPTYGSPHKLYSTGCSIDSNGALYMMWSYSYYYTVRKISPIDFSTIWNYTYYGMDSKMDSRTSAKVITVFDYPSSTSASERSVSVEGTETDTETKTETDDSSAYDSNPDIIAIGGSADGSFVDPSVPDNVYTNFITYNITCPVGQFWNDTLLIGGDEEDYNPTGACDLCPAGWSSPMGPAECEECPVGSYSPSEGSACLKCEGGYHSGEDMGSTNCSVCPAGTYAEEGAVIIVIMMCIFVHI